MINLWLALLKGSACQRARLIGNKSPIQSEPEGNMMAHARPHVGDLARLAVFLKSAKTQ